MYLGYRANAPRGLLTLLQIGLGLLRIRAAVPPGLLAHEFFLAGPFHVAFRQYWKDFASLKNFTVAKQHAAWWATLGKDTKGGGFWHEMYARGGGMEAMYINMPPLGLSLFAPPLDPVGQNMTSAGRLGRAERVQTVPRPRRRLRLRPTSLRVTVRRGTDVVPSGASTGPP